MATNKSLDVQFNKDWEKAVAWAQTQGIGANAIKSVYNADQQRVSQGDFPMSIAERNHALMAAQNPNKVTQNPSDKPSPVSFLGNVRSNLANIFTGLAPNHLIPNIFHSAETAIVHPQSWAKPIEQVAGGIASGQTKEIKAGLEAAGGPNSILSWVPGVYDLGQLAKGGIDALATQPITAFLDVAPFAPAGRVLDLAASEARLGDVASSLGITVDQLKKASVPQMATRWALMRPITKISGEGADAEIVHAFPGAGRITKMMTDPAGNPLTFSSLLSHWAQYSSGWSKVAASVASAVTQGQILGTDAQVWHMVPASRAEAALNDAEAAQLRQLQQSDRPWIDVMRDKTIDEKVKDAYDKVDDVGHVINSQVLASGELAMIRGPDGRTTEGYSAQGQVGSVVAASRDLHKETIDAAKIVGPINQDMNELIDSQKQTSGLVGTLEQLREAGLKETVQTFTEPVYTDISKRGKPTKPVRLMEARQRDILYGRGGLLAQIGDKLSSGMGPDGKFRNSDPETALAATKAAKYDLERQGLGRIEAAQHLQDAPSLQTTHNLLGQLEMELDRQVHLERSVRNFLLGKEKGKAFKGTFGERPKAERSKAAELLKRLADANKKFTDEWWAHPSDSWRSVAYDAMMDEIVHLNGQDEIVGNMSARLKELNHSERQINERLSDPRRLAEAIWQETRLAASNVNGVSVLDDYEIGKIYKAGIDSVNKLRADGHTISYIPVVTSRDIEAYDPGRYGVGFGTQIRGLSMAKKKSWTELKPERYDLMASLSLGTKEAIERANATYFVDNNLFPHAKSAGEVYQWAQMALTGQYEKLDPRIQTTPDLTESQLKTLGVRAWNPSKIGVSIPRWGEGDMYLPRSMVDAIEKLGTHNGFPMDGIYAKGTNIFRTSILGLSPRYTAHIVFGGMFLLALRSDPRVMTKLAEGWRYTKDPTTLPVEMRQVSAEMGTQPMELRTTKLLQAPRTPEEAMEKGLTAHAYAGGAQRVKWLAQERLDRQGFDLNNLNPGHWVKAVADINKEFTRRVSLMYRAASMLEYSDRAAKTGYFEDEDPETGQIVRRPMTAARAKEEGVQYALKVMGDLQSMTPLEKQSFMRIMPFYGWTRHILQYVLTYPLDHPYRAQFLAVQSTIDSNSVFKSLDTRIQFLLNLGSPDSAGNVKALDVRFLDPLRDTANYASLSGWLSALNPAIEAPLAAVDPQLIYGSTSLYPNVTYNQLYGIETSAPQGNPLVAGAEQFVSQIGALDAAYHAATNYRSLATTNPTQFYKTVFQSLNIPFAQVQDINLKQLAAKGEDARFNVAKTAAANAWKSPGMGGSGIENALRGYGAVPNPLNVDAGDITPAQLQQIYNAALAAYPGQNPADVVNAPPNAPGY